MPPPFYVLGYRTGKKQISNRGIETTGMRNNNGEESKTPPKNNNKTRYKTRLGARFSSVIEQSRNKFWKKKPPRAIPLPVSEHSFSSITICVIGIMQVMPRPGGSKGIQKTRFSRSLASVMDILALYNISLILIENGKIKKG